VGLVKKSRYKRVLKPGDSIILAGGKTGRDGIHGVTFASVELSSAQERSVVQIGDPIEEEKLRRAILIIRDQDLGSSITDLGGGGLSSAVGEMAERGECGATVHLDRVPLKHPGMEPWEIAVR
jgi:phosphoribosylformylglycinamidine synthase